MLEEKFRGGISSWQSWIGPELVVDIDTEFKDDVEKIQI